MVRFTPVRAPIWVHLSGAALIRPPFASDDSDPVLLASHAGDRRSDRAGDGDGDYNCSFLVRSGHG